MCPQLHARAPATRGAPRRVNREFCCQICCQTGSNRGAPWHTLEHLSRRFELAVSLWRTLGQPLSRRRPSSKRLLGQLPVRGWVRLRCTSATRGGAVGFERGYVAQTLGLVELTRAGVREASRRLLLAAPQAMRHHGLRASHARAQRRHTIRHSQVDRNHSSPAFSVGGGGVVAMARCTFSSAC
jgi:hypothetical protein